MLKVCHKQSDRLNLAIEFATKKHCRQFRKGTTIPYIVHPLEVLQILYSMRADTDIMIAGVLHDTVEDTDTTLDEIKELFGNDVAKLVASNSEDKSKTWYERKEHTIKELAKANINVKKLVMSDKLSNLRSIAYDYEQIGDELWDRFNAPKEKQAWYYNGILDSLYDIQFIPECEKAYWEITGLYKDVFVKYYIDTEKKTLYQISVTGEWYYFELCKPVWKSPLDEINNAVEEKLNKKDSSPSFIKPHTIPNELIPISRSEAEFIEDMWTRAI